MCMISTQGMNCSRDNCCHRNLNFCICQVWICNSAVIRLQGRGRSHPADHPFGGFPSYLPPCSHTSDQWQDHTEVGGDTGNTARVILQGLFWSLLILQTSEWAYKGLKAGSGLTCVHQPKCLATLAIFFTIPLAATETQNIIFYIVKSQDVYCVITSTWTHHNQELCSRGMNKSLCLMSINTCSF